MQRLKPLRPRVEGKDGAGGQEAYDFGKFF